jgi:hypothetical protein
MGMDTQHSFDNAACIWTMDMHGCRNADKKFSPASLVFRLFTTLSPASAFRHHGQSGTASYGPVRYWSAMLYMYTAITQYQFVLALHHGTLLFIQTLYYGKHPSIQIYPMGNCQLIFFYPVLGLREIISYPNSAP